MVVHGHVAGVPRRREAEHGDAGVEHLAVRSDHFATKLRTDVRAMREEIVEANLTVQRVHLESVYS